MTANAKESSNQNEATLKITKNTLMYEIIYFNIESQKETYGRDAFGEFGTLLSTDSDFAIPDIYDFQSEPQPISIPRNNSLGTSDLAAS